MTCRLSLRERNLGGAILRPLRLPQIKTKKLRYATLRSAKACCRTTKDTSPSHARSGITLAPVTRLDSSASDRYDNPSARTSRRAHSPSLNTTRTHPNTQASASP